MNTKRKKEVMAKIFRVGSKVCGSSLMAVVDKNFPLGWGNGFSLKTPEGETLSILNMSCEDFEEICKRKKLYNVEVLVDDDRCYIIDSRIPRDWFLKE